MHLSATDPRLQSVVNDEPEWQVREQAYWALPPDQLPFTQKEWARYWVDNTLSRIGRMQSSSGELGPSLPEALSEMLRDQFTWNWLALIEAAGSHSDQYVRGAAELAIRLRVERERSQLLKVLDVEDKQEGVLTVEVLGWGRSLPAVAHLVRMLADPDINIRIRVMHALVKIRADEAIPELIRCATSLLEDADSLDVHTAVVTVFSKLPIEAGRLKAASDALETSIAEADPRIDAEGIIAAVRALEATKSNYARTTIDKLSEVAKHSENQDTRWQAFHMVLLLPGGRETLMQPIYDRLKNGDYQGVIDEVGKDEPFVRSSPNLFLWRGMAFYSLGRFDRAIDDISQFLTSAKTVTAEEFAFYYSMLHEAGDTKKLTDAKAEAERRLPPEELKQFHELIIGSPD
jgi:hypothetical protein